MAAVAAVGEAARVHQTMAALYSARAASLPRTDAADVVATDPVRVPPGQDARDAAAERTAVQVARAD